MYTQKELIHKAFARLLINQVDEAVALLESIEPTEINDSWLYVRARCHSSRTESIAALECLIKIEMSSFNKKYNELFQQQIQTLEDDVLKIYYLERHPKISKDKHIQAQLTQLYLKLQNYLRIKEVFEQRVLEHPKDIGLKLEYIQFLKDIHSRDIFLKIDYFIAQHPDFFKFYTLLIETAIEKNERDFAHHALIVTYHRFPLNIDIHMKLINFYMLNGFAILAGLQMRYALWIFNSSWRICRAIEQLQFRYPELIHPIELKLLGPATLTPEITDGFKSLSTPYNEVYLVGSSVRYLLSGIPFNASQDLDFVSNTPPISSSNFTQSPHNYRLYSGVLTYTNGRHVLMDCYVSPYSYQNSLNIDVLTRDFTVNSFYCDRLGHIFDPTGMGIYDYYFKILRTIQPAVICFREDPIRILRAIKMILEGYHPTHDLVHALVNWTSDVFINQEHLYAVTRKLLLGAYRLGFVKVLLDMNLFQKLYMIEAKTSLDECLLDLDSLVFYQSSPQTYPLGL